LTRSKREELQHKLLVEADKKKGLSNSGKSASIGSLLEFGAAQLFRVLEFTYVAT